jgi:hypothetical protein
VIVEPFSDEELLDAVLCAAKALRKGSKILHWCMLSRVCYSRGEDLYLNVSTIRSHMKGSSSFESAPAIALLGRIPERRVVGGRCCVSWIARGVDSDRLAKGRADALFYDWQFSGNGG